MIHANVSKAEVKRMIRNLTDAGASKKDLASLTDRVNAGYNPAALREFYAVTMQYLRSRKGA